MPTGTRLRLKTDSVSTKLAREKYVCINPRGMYQCVSDCSVGHNIVTETAEQRTVQHRTSLGALKLESKYSRSTAAL